MHEVRLASGQELEPVAAQEVMAEQAAAGLLPAVVARKDEYAREIAATAQNKWVPQRGG